LPSCSFEGGDGGGREEAALAEGFGEGGQCPVVVGCGSLSGEFVQEADAAADIRAAMFALAGER
jgi:hypothetical protein